MARLHHSLANHSRGQRSNSLSTTYCCHLENSQRDKGEMSTALKVLNNGCALFLAPREGRETPVNQSPVWRDFRVMLQSILNRVPRARLLWRLRIACDSSSSFGLCTTPVSSSVASARQTRAFQKPTVKRSHIKWPQATLEFSCPSQCPQSSFPGSVSNVSVALELQSLPFTRV